MKPDWFGGLKVEVTTVILIPTGSCEEMASSEDEDAD